MDAQIEEAITHSNTSDENNDESSLHEPGSVASRQLLSETIPIRKSLRQVTLPVKLKDYEVAINCSSVKYPLAC